MRGQEFTKIPTDAPEPASDERLVSIKETQHRLGDISRRQVYNMINRKELQATRLGTRRVILESSLVACIARAIADAEQVAS